VTKRSARESFGVLWGGCGWGQLCARRWIPIVVGWHPENTTPNAPNPKKLQIQNHLLMPREWGGGKVAAKWWGSIGGGGVREVHTLPHTKPTSIFNRKTTPNPTQKETAHPLTDLQNGHNKRGGGGVVCPTTFTRNT